jgi:phospholipid-transporting ATPase
VTAIEDKLQDFVPETIQELKTAGIIVWVLTGDKIETAVSIGFSCSLLTSQMTLIEVTGIKKREIQDQITKGLEVASSEKALVISGDALLKATHPSLTKDLMKLADSCIVVLACRVSPQQKAEIVKLVREFRPNMTTLSIGDGANDVNMITAAHVGVGISGLEGSQAARASDYAISQFSYLKRLLFVHGRECYRRNTTLICFNFYKNVLLVTPIFFYGFFSVFSGQLIFNTWTYQLFNVTYAALPICVYAVFDRDGDLDRLDASHYGIGQQDSLFTTGIFWKWIFEAALQALLVCVVPLFALCQCSGYQETGHMNNVFVAGTLMYGLVVILVNVKILLFSLAFYWFNVGLIFFSIVFYFWSTLVLDSALPINDWLDNYEMRFSIYQIMKNPNSWVVILVVPFASFFIQPFFQVFLEYLQLRPVRKSLENEGKNVSLESI